MLYCRGRPLSEETAHIIPPIHAARYQKHCLQRWAWICKETVSEHGKRAPDGPLLSENSIRSIYPTPYAAAFLVRRMRGSITVYRMSAPIKVLVQHRLVQTVVMDLHFN